MMKQQQLYVLFRTTQQQWMRKSKNKRIIIYNNCFSRYQQQQQWSFFSSSSSSEGRERIYDPITVKEDRAYCVNLVRDRDEEGYLCGLLMPAKKRDGYYAIRAWNIELASIKDNHHIRKRDVASTSSFALQMRTQWWRNALEEIYNNNDDDDNNNNSNTKNEETTSSILDLSTSCWNSPVVRSLARTVDEYNLTRRFLERIIDAREMDLDIQQYNTMNEIIQYSEYTVSSLLYLTSELLLIDNNNNNNNNVDIDAIDEVLSNAGIGIGLTTALRATPYRLSVGGEVPIPSELFDNYYKSGTTKFPYYQLLPTFLGGTDDQIATLTDEEAIIWNDAIKIMVNTATSYLMQARNNQGNIIPKHVRICLLPIIPSLLYLEKLSNIKYNVFQQPTPDRLQLLLQLTRTWITGVL